MERITNWPFQRQWTLLPFLLFCVAGALLAGCSSDSDYKTVDFDKKIEIEHPNSKTTGDRTLRVAVAAMISPKETFAYYRELIDYIGSRLDYRIELIQRKTYGEINELFPKRQIDLAFICTGPYAAGREIYGFEAIATPVVRGEPFYQSYLIVNRDSAYQSLEDLRGSSFAFTDPDSNTGSLVPNFWLQQIKESANTFFGSITYTFSHDNSILAVAKGLVDAAAVDGHKWEYYHGRNPYYTSMTRVIRKSEQLGSPPLVVSVYLPQDLKERIRELILSMRENPEGGRILDGLMIDRFAMPQEDWYQPVLEMYRRVHAANGDSHASEDA